MKTGLLSTCRTIPILSSLVFGFIYVGVTALSIPGATILTLAAGAISAIYIGESIDARPTPTPPIIRKMIKGVRNSATLLPTGAKIYRPVRGQKY